MHRTTIELDDKLLRNLKEVCVREKKTFKQLILELVRSGWEVCYQQKKSKVSPKQLNTWVTTQVSLPKSVDPADRLTYWHLLERPLP